MFRDQLVCARESRRTGCEKTWIVQLCCFEVTLVKQNSLSCCVRVVLAPIARTFLVVPLCWSLKKVFAGAIVEDGGLMTTFLVVPLCWSLKKVFAGAIVEDGGLTTKFR